MIAPAFVSVPVEPSAESLEVGRKAVEDVLVEWRDSRLAVLRNNGLVIKERDGESSSIIRMTVEDALRIGFKAMYGAAAPQPPASAPVAFTTQDQLDRLKHEGDGQGIMFAERQPIALYAAPPAADGDARDGEFWSFLRRVLDQGTAIQQDYAAGKYPTYEHLQIRLDEAARERADQWAAMTKAPPC